MEPVTGYSIDDTLVYETTDSSGKIVEYVFEKGVHAPKSEAEADILARLCEAGVVSKAKPAPKSSKTSAEPKE